MIFFFSLPPYRGPHTTHRPFLTYLIASENHKNSVIESNANLQHPRGNLTPLTSQRGMQGAERLADSRCPQLQILFAPSHGFRSEKDSPALYREKAPEVNTLLQMKPSDEGLLLKSSCQNWGRDLEAVPFIPPAEQTKKHSFETQNMYRNDERRST